MKVLIPISTSNTQYYINQSYVKYALNAGLVPILVSPGNDLKPFVDLCEGLILPGGIDIDPTYYGEENEASYKVEPEKDEFERVLLYMFINAGKPVFGICRGLQLIMCEWLSLHPKVNEFTYLSQNIGGHEQTGSLSVEREIRTHKVDFLEGILYGNGIEVGKLSRMFVNSMHHQCIYTKSLTSFGGLTICATTRRGLSEKTTGSVVEACRIRWNNSNILAVQWHPEELNDVTLIKSFFKGSNNVKRAEHS